MRVLLWLTVFTLGPGLIVLIVRTAKLQQEYSLTTANITENVDYCFSAGASSSEPAENGTTTQLAAASQCGDCRPRTCDCGALWWPEMTTSAGPCPPVRAHFNAATGRWEMPLQLWYFFASQMCYPVSTFYITLNQPSLANSWMGTVFTGLFVIAAVAALMTGERALRYPKQGMSEYGKIQASCRLYMPFPLYNAGFFAFEIIRWDEGSLNQFLFSTGGLPNWAVAAVLFANLIILILKVSPCFLISWTSYEAAEEYNKAHGTTKEQLHVKAIAGAKALLASLEDSDLA